MQSPSISLILLGIVILFQTITGAYFLIKKSGSVLEEERRLGIPGRYLLPFGIVMLILFLINAFNPS
ncbi:MAG: hypothetical protein FJY98_02160 [Candidatus Liptonbacteria bacterium]|nr:hypothetical protein [Candidatus Liptonbacteria bacterium]